MRTLEWDKNKKSLKMVDQRVLPSKLTHIYLNSYSDVANSITDMAVRGAPAIGVAAAFGMALAAIHSEGSSVEQVRADLETAAQVLKKSRPTAVNLQWAVDRMMSFANGLRVSTDELKAALLLEAQKMADEDVAINKKMAENGAEIVEDGDTIIHHCNTGSLATVDWGTALGVIRMAHEQGKKIHVLVDETRPRLQGARLTAWELLQYGVPFDIISDNAAGFFLRSGKVDKVIFGADRVARNGDVANKIGSYMLALAAHANKVPVYSVFPLSTVDIELPTGDEIPIEERGQAEVLDLKLHDRKVTPENVSARNPAFDVTPNALFSGLITEKGIFYPPFEDKLVRAKRIERSRNNVSNLHWIHCV